MRIRTVRAYQIYDSRGNPTIEAVVELSNGAKGRGVVPSGASTGRYEALELRDGDPTRFLGRSVFRAIGHVDGEIASALRDRDALDQEAIDGFLVGMDGTANKSRLGANAILSVSMAVAQAAAVARGQALYQSLGHGAGVTLPMPEIQIFGGGKHANGRLDVQDFMIIPLAAQTFSQALEITFHVHQAAGRLMAKYGLMSGVADEGGYWPDFQNNEMALEVLIEAITLAGYTPGRDVGLSLDIAAANLAHDGRYVLALEKRHFSPPEFVALIVSWVERFPIVSIEDPLSDEDWEYWSIMRAAIGSRCQLVGDDLFTTNIGRLDRGISENAANAVLIKLNQIGTVTETMQAIVRAQSAGWLPIVSARSGETEDTFIAHLAVATNAGQLKVGALCRGERTAKWNEVLRIERELGSRAQFAGARLFGHAGIRLPGRES
jgi:enolase